MEKVCVFSEIHPYGPRVMERIRPKGEAFEWSFYFQAQKWFGLLDGEQDYLTRYEQPEKLIEDIAAAAAVAQERDLHLVIRDWPTIDYLGPYFQEKQQPDLLRRLIPDDWDIAEVSLIRHPLEQLISNKHLTLFDAMHPDEFFIAYLDFMQANEAHRFLRYEDFCDQPDLVLRAATEQLRLPYDEQWQQRWAEHTQVTGDNKTRYNKDGAIVKLPPYTSFVPGLLESIEESDFYWKILRATGYKHIR